MSSPLTSRWGRFAYPTKAALVYAVFSVAWILVSDQLIAYLAPDPDALTAISSAKGFLYVAITGSALFLLLTLRPHETFPGLDRDHAPAPRLFLILFIAMTTLALTLGTLLFRHFAARQKAEVSLQINSVVELKAALIARWLEENSRQSQMLMQSELLASHLRDWIATSSPANRIRIEQRLATLRTIMDADSILLTDITGIVRASKGERIAPAEVLKRHVRHAAKPAYTKFAIHQRAHSGIVARAGQLKAKLDAGEITLGAVVDFLAHDVVARHMLTADREFFPLFLSPATPSAA